MLRAGPSCRPAVCQVLRTDLFRSYQREFHHLTSRLCPNNVAPTRILPHMKRIKLREIWRQEYRALQSMVLRSGLENVQCTLARVLSTNLKRGLHSSVTCCQSDRGKDNDENDDEKRDKKDKRNDLQLFVKTMTYFTLALVLFLILYPDDPVPPRAGVVSWQEFVHHMLSKGEVQQIIVSTDSDTVNVILHENAVLHGKPVHTRIYSMHIPDLSRFEAKLRETERQLGINQENGVPVVFERQKDSAWPALALSLFIGFILLNILAAPKALKGTQMPWSSFTKAKFTLVDARMKGEGRGVHFSDIAGMKEAKQEVMEFVDYLKKPEIYRRLGAKVPKGSLLLGPPGCGKTLLAKAVATEANVPFLSMNGSEFIEVVGGLGASRVRDLFKEARRRAPCIVYIDEIDAIGGKRNDTEAGGEKVQTLLQLLIELDGMSNNEGVIMLASTNRSEVLDEALLRPGRFDRHILIAQPTLVERKEIFEVYLNKLKLDNPPINYSGRLAQLTPGYSGADIANICNEAALHAAGLSQKQITASDLEYAVSRVKFGPEKKARSISNNERKEIAYYQAGQTLVLWMLKNTNALMKVSIIQHTSRVGYISTFRPSRFLMFSDELYDRLTVLLSGRAAELQVFNHNSTQAEKDLKRASGIAYQMITSYGMNDVVGEVSFPSLESSREPFYSRKLHSTIDFEARKIITQCFNSAQQILKENSDKLEKLAEELLKKETLTYNEVCDIIGPPPHGPKALVEILEFGDENSSPPNDETNSRKSPNDDDEGSPNSSGSNSPEK